LPSLSQRFSAKTGLDPATLLGSRDGNQRSEAQPDEVRPIKDRA
jgi:hypothetical protein